MLFAHLFFATYLSAAVRAAATCQDLTLTKAPAVRETPGTRNIQTLDPTSFKLPWNATRTTSSSLSGTHPTTTWPPTSNSTQILQPTGTSHGAWHSTSTVTVGRGGELVFSPSTLNASVGSTIAFNFLSINHTLTESTLMDPCQSNSGFDSGFQQFNPTNTSGRFVVEYKVSSIKPKWFFCAQIAPRSHCHAGMVFSLNPVGAHDTFMQNALAAIPTQDRQSACRQPPIFTAPLGNISDVRPTISRATTSGSKADSTAILPLIVSSANGLLPRSLLFVISIAFLLV
ncbi:hypothetical protein HBI81_256760 [Parastagonospora nodorum]|nr:hypothetical protein HBH97_254740 [Parastagonospora nodorum]KAH6510762.1 hypothetical protein HBI81_256760 [Parastagonospora nodorum]